MEISFLVVFLTGLLVYLYMRRMRYTGESRGKIISVLLVTAAILFVVYVSSKNNLFGSFSNKPYQEDYARHIGITTPKPVYGRNQIFYGIVFDAGSTGSRIHVYEFKYVAPNIPYKLVSELFEKTKPGLSSYAENPQLGADSLKEMLDHAKSKIPKEQWSSTPIELKATAGLRLLGPHKSEAILAQVRSLFKSYPFSMNNDSAIIMGGTDEGIFCWFTVNFLTGGIGDQEKMVGIMDLGGGSTQITFVPNHKETIDQVPKDYIKDINIFGKKYNMYTHSYLGLGLMSARLKMMGGSEEPGATNPDTLSSACFPPEYNGKYEHHSKKVYNIRGVESDNSFRSCYDSAKQLIKNSNIHKPKEANEKQFMVISYFYDRAVDAHLISADEETLTLDHVFQTAEQACLHPSDKPYLCMDLVYICALLHDGYGFKKDVELKFVKKLHKTEISWALGAAFYMLNKPQNSNTKA